MSVLVERDVACTTRDGIVLRADVYRPADDGHYPVLLLRTPYGKGFWPFTHSTLDPVRAADAGYVVVIQDTRGRWASEGSGFMPYADEFRDGADTVQWAAGLPYADGSVGIYGLSYMGATAWHAAAEAPPALRAIAPTQTPNDHFINQMWRGGALLWGTHLYWSLAVIGPLELARERAGSPDLPQRFAALVDAVDAFDDLARHLPPCELPTAGGLETPFLPYFYDTMRHPTRDEFYRSRSMYERHGEVRVPALIVAGWHDVLLAGDLEHFAQMRTQAPTQTAREQTRLVIGPWSHGLFLNVIGQQEFGLRASGALIDLKEDLTSLHLRWFDRWLKGSADDDGPRVKLFVQGANRWRDEDDWPLAHARATPWYLGARGGLGPAPPRAARPPRSFLYDPLDPCPTIGGALLMPRTYASGPVDQERLLSRPDVLVYTSETLEDDLEVTGPVSAVLFAATSARDTDWVVKLCDVHADGRTFNVCDGILRARFRAGDWTSPTLVEPEEIIRYEVDLWATSIVFRRGHRLRVLVTSSDFPRYDRNPNTGELGVEARETAMARQRVFSDAEHPSHVLLPTVPPNS